MNTLWVKLVIERTQMDKQLSAPDPKPDNWTFAVGNDVRLLGTADFAGVEVSRERGVREYDGQGNVIVTLPEVLKCEIPTATE